MTSKRLKLSDIRQFCKPVTSTTSDNADADNSTTSSKGMETCHTEEIPCSSENESENASATIVHHESPDSCETSLCSNDKSDIPQIQCGKLYYPDAQLISRQKAKSQNVNFQGKWFDEIPWLHFDNLTQKVTYFHCAKAENKGLSTGKLERPVECTFISTGFCNWKKTKQKFNEHQSSSQHRFAIFPEGSLDVILVTVQLHDGKKKQQEECKRNLVKIFRSLRFLLRQGSALCEHSDTEVNFLQLMKLLEEEDPELTADLSKKTTFTSPQAQNEIMEMFSHQILRNIAHEVQQSKIFALMVGGPQDVTGAEQEAICVR